MIVSPNNTNMSIIKPRPLPEKYETMVQSINSLSDKFILGGSLALYILGLQEYEFENRTPDYDFSLKEKLTENELQIIQDFFGLTIVARAGDYETIEPPESNKIMLGPKKDLKHFLNKKLIQFKKYDEEESDSLKWPDFDYKLDIFNSEIFTSYDYIHTEVPSSNGVDSYWINLLHPSIIYGAKMKYAADVRVGKRKKHFQDIKAIDWTIYDNQMRNIKTWYQGPGTSLSNYFPDYTPEIKEEFDKAMESVTSDLNTELPF